MGVASETSKPSEEGIKKTVGCDLTAKGIQTSQFVARTNIQINVSSLCRQVHFAQLLRKKCLVKEP